MGKHGLAYTRVYRIWIGMKARCFNQNHPKFHAYGAKGITICERWLDFEKFFEDMGHPPSEQHSIDRYPNKKGSYEPGNCRWATKKEQMENTSRTKEYTYNGEIHCLKEWSRILGIPSQTLWNRLNRSKWTVEQAFESDTHERINPHDGGWSKR